MTGTTIPACPVCLQQTGEPLLSVERAPLSCAKLYPSLEKAREDRGCNLQVMVCICCGHIWNSTHVDEPQALYDEDYYSSFTASPQARAAQQVLAQELHQCINLAGKTVLEIGCGDGFFLASLASLGARGVGFEPSGTYHLAKAHSNVQVTQGLFDFDGTFQIDWKVDVVVMRHVLEHMTDPTQVLERIGGPAFQGAAPGWLFLEVPNALQLLKDNLYFDFYNDHVHYFSRPSLSCLAARTGWHAATPLPSEPEFLRMMLSRPGQSAMSYQRYQDEKVDLLEAAGRFRASFQRWRQGLLGIVDQLKAQGKRIAVWGAGARGIALITGLDLPLGTFDYLVDSDPNKHGRYTPVVHLPVYSPEYLEQQPVDYVLVTSYTYFDEIVNKLEEFRSKGGSIVRVYPSPEVVS